MQTLKETNFRPNVKRGKVRDVYEGKDNALVIVTTDRISAYDCILNQQVPYKGQCLNRSSVFSFDDSMNMDISVNALVATPHPNITVMENCQAYPVEVVIRGYLSGSAWRGYMKGRRKFFDTTLPEGLRQNQNLMEVIGGPLHTPTTKADIGKHDEDLTQEDVETLVGKPTWRAMRDIGAQLFLRANELAGFHGYAEADTKYEFGKSRERSGILLIDEANTHDSSRFFRLDSYQERFEAGQDLNWIDKEYVRAYLASIGFRGDGPVPDLPQEIIDGASERLLESVYAISGQRFAPREPNEEEIREAAEFWLK